MPAPKASTPRPDDPTLRWRGHCDGCHFVGTARTKKAADAAMQAHYAYIHLEQERVGAVPLERKA